MVMRNMRGVTCVREDATLRRSQKPIKKERGSSKV